MAPFAPGGGSDFTSRLIAEKLSRGSARPCWSTTSRAPAAISARRPRSRRRPTATPILTISGSYAINSILHKPSFDSLNDIVAIGQFTDEPTVLVRQSRRCRPRRSRSWSSSARREPGKLTYGSSGPGGLVHLGTEFFLDAAGIKATHVPYRGTAPALTDLLAGNLQILTGGTTTMLPYIKNGQVRRARASPSASPPRPTSRPTASRAIRRSISTCGTA